MPTVGANLPQRILLCHAYYRQRGGEDESFEAEAVMLANRGHEVVRYTYDNRSTEDWSHSKIASVGFWNPRVFREISEILKTSRIQMVQCTNLFPFMSPSVYFAARKYRVPVVQALRNYRLGCVNSLLLREGKICTDCLGSVIAWKGALKRCYRQSLLASSTVALQSVMHRWLGVNRSMVDGYFTPSQFSRELQIRAGIPADRISVKPNFLHPVPDIGNGNGKYMLFVGRLSEEKGVRTLLSAWKQDPSLPKLKIAGDGPLRQVVETAVSQDERLEYLGQLAHEDVLGYLSDATCLLIPSIWYETFGRTIMEALATGTPIIASRLGAMIELVDEDVTGKLFNSGDSFDLIRCIRHFMGCSERTMATFRTNARSQYLQRFTADRNYDLLMDIYRAAIQRKRIGDSVWKGAPTVIQPTETRGVLP